MRDKTLAGIRKCFQALVSGEFICFLGIGILNALNNTMFSSLYAVYLQDNLAFVLGYGSSLCIAYLLNARFTFRKKKIKMKEFFRFVISYIPNFVIQNIIVIIFMNVMGLHRVFTYAMAAIIGVPVTFFCVKFFAFSK